MNATPTRQLVLGGALAATLAATAWVATRPDDEAAAVVAPVRRQVLVAAAASAVPAAMPDAGRAPWAEASPEQLSAWQPPPPPPPPAPPPVAAAPPPPPMAPPLPYQMIGRVVEGDGAKAVQVALLTSPNHALSVRRGDVIDGQWRVDQVSSSGISLTWLPAKIPQNLVFKAIP